ncbi:hypothetical protein [Pedobacter agri]|uniref:hypothetical protein n=1 Tax=Pedobacter agri TaxID=454586 RepID=UPI0002EBF8CA|nr:hypothetical protein [Pedobacter agri]
MDYKQKLPQGKNSIVVAAADDKVFSAQIPQDIKKKALTAGKEGFFISTDASGNFYLIGADHSGTLYGCLDLIDRIAENKSLPAKLAVTDHPEMVLRGTCIGLQKPDYLPGHDVYEYPYTEESFPWLYDKKLWIKYLDMMVDNRYNSLYLWNGHPFSSLLRLKEYPYAVEVDDATLKKK